MRGRFSKRVARVVSRRTETKHHFTTGGFAVTTAGIIVDISVIPVGTDERSRIGTQVWLTSLQSTFNCMVADNFNFIRILLFQWHMDTNVDVPEVGDIIYSATNPIISQIQDNKDHRFSLLRDRTIRVDSASNSQSVKRFKITRRFRRKMQFTRSSAGGLDHIFYLLLSDSITTPHPGVNISSKINFQDS